MQDFGKEGRHLNMSDGGQALVALMEVHFVSELNCT